MRKTTVGTAKADPRMKNFTVMHWWGYALMEERDPGHLFECLRTLLPVDNEVVIFDERSTAFEESKWNWSERMLQRIEQ
jgi:hypothetical protein